MTEIDENLKPLTPGETFNDEFAMLAEMLGGLSDIEDIFISFQNKIIKANMQCPVGNDGLEQRLYHKIKYEFYNKIRTEIYNFKKRNAAKKR